jgi:hypothetical protein
MEAIQLHSPANDEHVSLGSGIADQPRFSWQGMGPEYTYRFELFLVPGWRDILAEDILGSQAPEIENGDHLIFPVIRSETSSELYILSLRDIERLQKGIPYLWHVAVYLEGKLVSSSLYRSVYFSDPPPEAGGIIFEYLDVIELPEGSSTLLKSFEAGNAYAGDLNKRFEIKPGRTFLIRSSIKNDSNRPKMGIFVQFLVDGELVDQSFIPSLEAGGSEDVEGKYTVARDDIRSHTLELKVTTGFGKNVEVLAGIQAHLANTESE